LKGSLVILKNLGHVTKTGIVMSDPWKIPKYTHDFLDGYRHWDGEESQDPADHRMTVYAVEVYWPEIKKTTQHRLNELDFLHLKR
jgi:hypothetical protein